MRLGIFAKTFPGGIEANMAAVAASGIEAVQYNLSIAGIDTVPALVPPRIIDRIARAATEHHIALAAISGTFNAAHPDPRVRRDGIQKFPELAAAAVQLGIPVITLSSGSRDQVDMWRHHADNGTPEAWADSRDTLQQLAVIAESTGITIAVEPEHTNVVSTAELGRRMLDEVGSDRLKIVFDAANLIDTDDLSAERITAVIGQAIELLGADVALAHAKELVPGRAQVAPGQGVLPWPEIITALDNAGYYGTVVVHGLTETGVPGALATLDPLLARTA